MSVAPSRIWRKVEETGRFFLAAGTPMPLILDSFRLKRTPFVAETLDGLKLRLKPSCGESFTFYENLIRKDYLQHGVALNAGDTVVDIGSNIGAFTVLAASIVGRAGRVISLEPARDSFARLVENIDLNGFSNVTALNFAIGGAQREAELGVGAKSAYSSIQKEVDGRRSTGLSQLVKVRTLPDVLDEIGVQAVDFLKIDCEGAEYEIIGNLPSEWANRIAQISMEVHDVPGCSRRQLVENLTALGFKTREENLLVALR